MGKETSLWKWLQQAERKLNFTPLLHWRRIENLVAEGDPDVEGCYNGVAFNIELKTAERPARETTRVLGPADIRPRQIPWAKARWAAGGSTFFLVQVGSSARAARYLIPGKPEYMDKLVGSTEIELYNMSIVSRECDQVQILANATSYRSPSL